MVTIYPAPLEFDLPPGEVRDHVLAAASALGLLVKHWDDRNFSVVVATPMEACHFGEKTGLAILLRKPPEKTRRIDAPE